MMLRHLCIMLGNPDDTEKQRLAALNPAMVVHMSRSRHNNCLMYSGMDSLMHQKVLKALSHRDCDRIADAIFLAVIHALIHLLVLKANIVLGP